MDNNMSVDKKILEEINRYNSINRYIVEQDVPPADPTLPPPPADPTAGAIPPVDPTAGATPPPPPAGDVPTPIDVEADPDVEKVEDEKKELEITDLVKAQKTIANKQEEYFEQLFGQLENLESRLGEMGTIFDKLNNLENKIEKYRQKTPEEKMELRTIDSGPFNQKLSDFFEDKQEDFEKTGREEYILTQDEVQDYSPTEIKRSFRAFDDEDDTIDNFKRIS
jgi:hypothetical protein